MKYNPKIVISVCVVVSLLFAGGLIFYIQSNGGGLLPMGMIIYFVLYFNILLGLYITNTWIFEKYEHDTTPVDEFARPYGVHTFPLENLCTYEESNGKMTSVTCPSNKDGSPQTYKGPFDANDFTNWINGTVKHLDCPDGFKNTTDTNGFPCMNSKKQVVCWDGTLQSSDKCPVRPPSS